MGIRSQARRADISKPSASEAVTKLYARPMRWNEGNEMRVPEARHNLAQREAEGETLGQVGHFMRVAERRQSFVTASSALGRPPRNPPVPEPASRRRDATSSRRLRPEQLWLPKFIPLGYFRKLTTLPTRATLLSWADSARWDAAVLRCRFVGSLARLTDGGRLIAESWIGGSYVLPFPLRFPVRTPLHPKTQPATPYDTGLYV